MRGAHDHHVVKRVLIADDDAEFLEIVGTALRRLHLDVVTAICGVELLDKLANEGAFDLVITDVAMPWMSGLQVMHSARAAGMKCPVIVMTALRSIEVGKQVTTLGSHVQLLLKPFTTSMAEVAIQRALHFDMSIEHDKA
jgi:two-component system, OmpR family, response regulator TctD